ncbi:lytic transglycosylase domain-containing protein [bacterium]|nr:lytic transglycosylase domain-containing protein [bacterium]
MFSPKIQNLIDSSGQQAAIQRYTELKAKISSFGNSIEPPQLTDVKPFAKVLKDSAATTNVSTPNTSTNTFGSFVKGGDKKVSQKIYNRNDLNALIGVQNLPNGESFASKMAGGLVGSKNQIMDMVTKISKRHGVDDKLVKALIKQESGFKVDAKSKVGAMGLMQLMPATAKSLGVKDPMNPVENVEGGVTYLKSMLDKYNGNVILALAAYNAGPGAVDKYDGVPPYPETQNYVKNILRDYL